MSELDEMKEHLSKAYGIYTTEELIMVSKGIVESLDGLVDMFGLVSTEDYLHKAPQKRWVVKRRKEVQA